MNDEISAKIKKYTIEFKDPKSLTLGEIVSEMGLLYSVSFGAELAAIFNPETSKLTDSYTKRIEELTQELDAREATYREHKP